MARSFSTQARFEKLEKSLSPDVRNLMDHPLYGELRSLEDIRVFMESHVYAVWDFMSLVKALQLELTSVRVPWLPPSEPLLARFLNEIVLGEESDDLGNGLCLSHCGLYLLAMGDVAADAGIFQKFLSHLRSGLPLRKALTGLAIPPHAKKFVLFTLSTARLPVHQVAASFLYGRESVIPDMFQKIVAKVGRGENARLKFLVLYLDRHIEVDRGSHGPMARRLLIHLCGTSETKWVEAERTARRAIEARLALWDGVLRGIRDARLV